MEAGLDSLAVVELRSEISNTFGLELPVTTLFNYPTITALANFIAAQLESLSGMAVDADLATLELKVVDAIAVEAEILRIVRGMVEMEISSSQPLMEAGLDSLAAVEFLHELEKRFEIDLPATVMFDYPTVAALAQHTAGILAAEGGTLASGGLATAGNLAAPSLPAQQDTVTNLVGLSCRYPTTSNSLVSFWQGALQPVDLPETVPLDRWDLDRLYAPQPTNSTMYARFGTFVHDVDKFDWQVGYHMRGLAMLQIQGRQGHNSLLI